MSIPDVRSWMQSSTISMACQDGRSSVKACGAGSLYKSQLGD